MCSIKVSITILFVTVMLTISTADDSKENSCSTCPGRSLTCCPSGPGGKGGCYQEPGELCCTGKICSNPRTCCPAGSYGNGGCIQEPKESCCEGRVCRSGFKCCSSGSKSSGGCYVEFNKKCCPDGSIVAKTDPCL